MGEKWKLTHFILGGSKITVDSDCSHKINNGRKQRKTKEPLDENSVTQSCPTLCNPMDCSTPGLPVPHRLPEFLQARVR